MLKPSHRATATNRTLIHYNKCRLSTSNSTDLPLYSFQPGGTATIITNNYVGHIDKQIQDTTGLGRWSGFRLKRKNNKHLSIITAYTSHTKIIIMAPTPATNNNIASYGINIIKHQNHDIKCFMISNR